MRRILLVMIPLAAVVLSALPAAGQAAQPAASDVNRGGNYAITNREGTTSCHQVSIRGDTAFHVFVVEGGERWKGGIHRAKRERGTRFLSNIVQGFILKPGRLVLIEVDSRPFRIPAVSRARTKALGCPLNY